MSSNAVRLIRIEGPFQAATSPLRDAKVASATIEVGERRYRVSVIVSGPSEMGFAATKVGSRMDDKEREEARLWFSLLELANRPIGDFEAEESTPPEIKVSIPVPPGPIHQEWTIEKIRRHVRQELKGYEIARKDSVLEARASVVNGKQRIESIEISGYRPFDGFKANLGDLTVIIGANATGKSSLFDFLRFICFASSSPLPPEIDPKSVGKTLFHVGSRERILFTLVVNLGQRKPLRYEAEVTGPIGTPRVARERLTTTEPLHPEQRDPFIFLDFRGGRGIVRDQVERKLTRPEWTVQPNELALRRALDPTLRTLSEFQSFLSSWRFYSGFDVSGSAAIRRPVSSEPNPTLADDGANLSAVLFSMMSEHTDTWEELETHLRSAIPGFESLSVRPQGGPGTIIGVWREAGVKRDLTLADLSDGTLRLLCWATLCLSVSMPPLVCIDEPELGLHPRVLPTIAGLLRVASARSQILVATHSPYFLSHFSLDEIAVMRKEDGKAVFLRPATSSALRREVEELGGEAIAKLHISDDLEIRS